MTPPRKVTVRPAVAVAAIVVAGLVGAGLRSAAASGRSPERRTAVQEHPVAPVSAPGPARLREGVPAGFARTREGAVAAAASFVTTGQAVLGMADADAQRAVRQMAAAAMADTQVQDLLARLTAARAALAGGSGPTVYRQAAVSARVDGWSRDRARVAIWNVGVLSRAGAAPPQAGWATSMFDLVWERGDWKVWSETITPGPAPIMDASAAPATADQFAAALDGFFDLGTSP